MADYIRAGTCGACKEFEFEGNDKKGYCRYYRAYYWDSDSCRHYDEDERRLSSGGSGCFLTTACCQYKGLPDDCTELTILRNFRDNVLMQNDEERNLVEEYYRIAPELVERIEQQPDARDIYEQIYMKIQQIIEQINKDNYASAINCYKDMVYTLQDRLL